MIDLRSLRTFVTIAEVGGVHRAAAKLNITQPALSRQIKALEAELGLALFDRIGRRLQLTSEGGDLLRRCRQLLGDADAIIERAEALKKGDTGTLRVGATPQVIENTLAPFLGEYQCRHPRVEVQLVEDGGIRLSRRLATGEIQLALTVDVDERFVQRLLYPGIAVAVLSTDHRLGRHRTIQVEELSEEALLLLHPTFASREWFDTACSVANFRPRILLESGAPHTIMALAGRGFGIAIIPSTVAVPSGNVCGIPLTQSGLPLGRWLLASWEARRFMAAYAEHFVEELVQYCGRIYPGDQFTGLTMLPPKPRNAIA